MVPRQQKDQAAAIPKGPDYMVFEWDEHKGLRNWAMGFGFEKLPCARCWKTPCG